MNTPDKILLGLACHARSKCSDCPYEDMPECSSKLAADAEKFLNAAVADMTELMQLAQFCRYCKHLTQDGECAFDFVANKGEPRCWQWRGVEVE